MDFGQKMKRKKRNKKKKYIVKKIIFLGFIVPFILIIITLLAIKFLEHIDFIPEREKEYSNLKEFFINNETESTALEDVGSEDSAISDDPRTQMNENYAQNDQNMEDANKLESYYIETLTLEEKVGQMFIITPEALTKVGRVVAAGETTKNALHKYPVGGLVYFESNIQSEKQFVEMVQNSQTFCQAEKRLPLFICLDEEGGTVSRISGRGFTNVPDIPTMHDIGVTENCEKAYDVGRQIGEYLNRFHVNVNFAPVADICSNENNTVIGNRSFGKESSLVASMVENEIKGFKDQNIATAIKHFPGHGGTTEDSHSDLAYSYKTLDELRGYEFIPFEAGIKADTDFVMVGHISLPNILGNNVPASLSYTVITEILRNEMGFEGIVITDALNMGAIAHNYNSADAAVRAIQAGADMILMPSDFVSAYNGILEAVRQGIIDEKRIDESLERIIRLKIALFNLSSDSISSGSTSFEN